MSAFLREDCISEEEGYTPYTAEGDKGIHDSGNNSPATAEDKSDKVKSEHSDESPIDTADDKNNQAKSVKEFHKRTSFSYFYDILSDVEYFYT